MADQPKALEPEAAHNQQEDENETEQLQELEMLVAEVNQMAQTILDYRASLPHQLKSTLASLLSAQRPPLPTSSLTYPDHGLDSGPSGNPNSDVGRSAEASNDVALVEEDQETADKIRLLKDKISSNASAMPVVLKRMKDCMSRIDKLDSCNGIIHPAFKRKRPS